VAGEQAGIPPAVDTGKANVARVYDYWLGGTSNFLADQDAARALIAVEPGAREIARANRAFLGRAVRFQAASGIRQFLDIGSGIPTQRNVHEVAQEAAPGSRVVYVDMDPVVVAHSKAILDGREDAAAIQADLREPEKILDHPDTRRLIDFGQPVGVLLVAVLHFISEAEEPRRLVGALRDRLAPGSYLTICHGTGETSRHDVAEAVEKVYNRKVTERVALRSRAEIRRFFDGFDLVEPGLVFLPEWRPDSTGDVPDDPSRMWGLVGVGKLPGPR
jgi:S-adenosyl methyltransferase